MNSPLIAALAIVLGFAPRAVSQDSSTASKLKVHVTYSGTGAVDDKHKVYVILWDTPDFVSTGGMPVEIESTPSKDGSVTFEDVKKSPAYVSTVYDPSGQWDAQSAPPEGCSIGLYSKTPGKPEPIELAAGKTTTIDLTFNDSVKMPPTK